MCILKKKERQINKTISYFFISNVVKCSVWYILYNNIVFYCSKVQYLMNILIKAKALVLNRNYISTHSHVSDVMQMKKKSYIKFYFSFIYNYLNWLSYIHRKKKVYKKNNSNHKYYVCFIFRSQSTRCTKHICI